MNKAVAACGLLCLLTTQAAARGVSPYLPLNLDPSIERQIERVLILADKPVLTRPLAAATVLDALPKACRSEPVLCQEVRRYLARYMRNWSVTEAGVEVASSSDAAQSLPNRYGLTTASDWAASAHGYWQPSDYALVSVGAVAYQGEIVPEGSLVSVGFDRAQLDLGYRARWMSPLTDSSMLVGTNAATMPSITLSNYVPLTRFGLQYQAFISGMSRSDRILFQDGFTSGHPRLAGVHLSIEPASGWSLGANRLLQFGGGGRGGNSFGELVRAFINPSRYDNVDPTQTDEQFGNQLASITSQFLFPGRTPFTVYFEYAGEDTSYGRNYLLGNSALSGGIRFPQLWKRFDLTYEVSEWQNLWYVSGVYGDGLTNDGHVIGHWGGDARAPGDAVGALSQMLRIGWQPKFGGTLDLRLRTLSNESYGAVDYERAYNATLRYSYPVGQFDIGAEIFAGKDVFGESFSRTAAFVRFRPDSSPLKSSYDSIDPPRADPTAELFVDAGIGMNRVRIEPPDHVRTTLGTEVSPHFGIGARRAVSDRSDLGARIELDDIDGHVFMGVRAIDYRYRFANPLALTVFVGAARYDLATPAYGTYVGAGLQWRNVLPRWDAEVALRYASKVARDNVLPNDAPVGDRPDTYYDVYNVGLSLTRRF
jgi:hypothetical protein